MKKCSRCGEVLPFGAFHKNIASHDGVKSACKQCTRNKRRSFRNKIEDLYHSHVARSIKRNHKAPMYNKEELITWCENNKIFIDIYNTWVKSNYNRKLAPSIDRLDDYKGYSFNNIRVVTFAENEKKSYEDRKNGKNNKSNVAVVQFDLQGNIIGEYYSQHHASRVLGIDQGNISRSVRSKDKCAGGFKFKYKKDV